MDFVPRGLSVNELGYMLLVHISGVGGGRMPKRYERQQEREAYGRASQIYNQIGDWREFTKCREALWNGKRVD